MSAGHDYDAKVRDISLHVVVDAEISLTSALLQSSWIAKL